MALYTSTISTTAIQERGLALELARENAKRAARVPPLPPITNVAELLDMQVSRLILRVLDDEYERTVRGFIGRAVDTATSAQLTNAAAALGVIIT